MRPSREPYSRSPARRVLESRYDDADPPHPQIPPLLLVLGGCGATEATAPRVGGQGRPQGRSGPPLPKPRPKLVEPVAGQVAERGRGEGPPRAPPLRRPTRRSRPGPASGALEHQDTPSAINGGTRNATALDNGVALPPLEAPAEVLKIIEAGNATARTPYKWGGGHGRFLDTGYDCSGSVSFALYAAALIEGSARLRAAS